MATVVFLSLPAPGHINPTLPLVAELVHHGEQVIYYTSDEFQAAIELAGATYRPYGKALPFHALRNQHKFEHHPLLAVETLLETSLWVLAHLQAEIQTFHPDYLIYDACCLWGNYLAQILHLPAIVSLSTMAANQRILNEILASIHENIAQAPAREYEYLQRCLILIALLCEHYHLKPPRDIFAIFHNYGDLALVYTSRVFQLDAASFDEDHFKFVGPLITSRTQAPPFPFAKLSKQPIIYISLGTMYSDRATFFHTCLEALAESPWQIVMATGHNLDPALSGPLPPHIIVEKFVPQLEVLQHTALFITHGGMNSISEALYYHVPMVVIPQSMDQPWNAARVAELGAGKMLTNAQVTPESLRRSIEEVLANPSFARAATYLGESLHSAGGVQKAITEILAFKHTRNIP